jgi:ATP-dependent RNA helicase DDX19/DBP5
MKSWEDEDFALDEDLKKGIVEELEFNKPSRI